MYPFFSLIKRNYISPTCNNPTAFGIRNNMSLLLISWREWVIALIIGIMDLSLFCMDHAFSTTILADICLQ